MTADKQNPADQLEVMRIALIVQIHELIDVAVRQAHRMHKLGDTEERDYINGAIDHALKVIAPFNYNGLRQAPPESAAAVPGWKLVPICLTPEMRIELLNVNGLATAELYTMLLAAAPPAPAREPLTDEQIHAVRDAISGPVGLVAYARAIEAAHNIKAAE